jgi:hypothetical protein
MDNHGYIVSKHYSDFEKDINYKYNNTTTNKLMSGNYNCKIDNGVLRLSSDITHPVQLEIISRNLYSDELKFRNEQHDEDFYAVDNCEFCQACFLSRLGEIVFLHAPREYTKTLLMFMPEDYSKLSIDQLTKAKTILESYEEEHIDFMGLCLTGDEDNIYDGLESMMELAYFKDYVSETNEKLINNDNQKVDENMNEKINKMLSLVKRVK